LDYLIENTSTTAQPQPGLIGSLFVSCSRWLVKFFSPARSLDVKITTITAFSFNTLEQLLFLLLVREIGKREGGENKEGGGREWVYMENS
jgi:hypothetical protein